MNRNAAESNFMLSTFNRTKNKQSQEIADEIACVVISWSKDIDVNIAETNERPAQCFGLGTDNCVIF